VNEFKGTPGPWDYGWEIQPNGCPTVGHKGLMVCMVAHSAKEPDQKETALANADLISAAPELLSALQHMVACHYPDANGQIGAKEECWDSIQNAQAVIAKALGK